MRRSDRAVTDPDAISNILDACEIGHLGLCDDEGPYVVPISFVHELRDGLFTVFFHTANEGRKVAAIRAGLPVCFETCRAQATDRLPGNDVTLRFESVIGTGTARIIKQGEAARTILSRIVAKYVPDYYGALPSSLPTVVAIDLNEVTGKRNAQP